MRFRDLNGITKTQAAVGAHVRAGVNEDLHYYFDYEFWLRLRSSTAAGR